MLSRLHVYSVAPALHTFIPPRRYTFNAPPDLHNAMPPRGYTGSEPPDLQMLPTSICRLFQPS